MNSKETFDIQEAIKAQAKYCKDNNFPHFAPSNGRCWCCHRNIYEQIGWGNELSKLSGMLIRRIQLPIDSSEVKFITGISVEKAGSELITGCPHCNRTYCD